MDIYVGNLPKTTNEETVRKLFEEYGQVTEVKLIKDQYSDELRGFGFVSMPSQEEAKDAIEKVNGVEMEGRTITVNEARPKKGRPGGGGGGGGRGPRRGGSQGPRSRSW